MSTDTLIREHVETRTTDIPADASHIVMVPPGEPDETPQAYVLRARIEGLPITAICGHVFTPQKDPKPLPVCEGCMAVYHQDGENRDDRNDLPDA